MTAAFPHAVRLREPAPALPEADRAIGVGFVVHSMHVAGAEVLVREIIRRLRGKVRPAVFCLDDVGAIGCELRAEGVEVICCGRRPGRDLRVAWRLAREVQTRGLHILHAHQYTPFFYAALARALTGGAVRLVLTEHGRHYPDIVSRPRRLTNRLLLGRLADEITAVCGFSAESLTKRDGFPQERVTIVENGVDASRYVRPDDRPEARRAVGLDPDRRYIVNVARFHPVKDHETLIRAFRRVAARRPTVDLLLVGDGPLRTPMERLVERMDLTPRVHCLGLRSDVPAILGAADAFVLTSLSEAASLTLLEAMASGTPVVVSDVGGNPEIVRNGIDGLCVPRGDVAGFAAALQRVLDNPVEAEAFGRAALARARSRYQIATTVDRYCQLYARLAGRH